LPFVPERYDRTPTVRTPARADEQARSKVSPSSPRDGPERHRLFWVFVGAYGLVLFAWSSLRHAHYGSHAYDLGAYHQVFYNLGTHGNLWSPIEQIHQWSAHLEVGLLPVGLLYRAAPTPLWLFALQATACAATAVPVEALARRFSGDSRIAFLCAIATLLTPQLLFASISDFHSITLCTFPMALLVLGIETDALLPIVVGSALALSLREQMGLPVFVAAITWVVRHGRARIPAAIVLGAAGLSVFFAEVLWLIPSFAGGGTFRYVTQNYALGSSPEEAFAFAFSHPLRFAALPFEGRRRLVYPLVLASGAVLPILVAVVKSPRRAAVPLLTLAPLLLVQLYSAKVLVFSVETQYGAPLVPLIGAAAAVGVGVLAARRQRVGLIVALTWLVATTTHAIGAVGPLAFEQGGPLDRSFAGSPRERALARAVGAIPREALVSAQDAITPHLEGDIRLWPAGEETARFVVLDANVSAGAIPRQGVATAAERLRKDPRFDVKVDEGGVILLERRPTEGD
jgi:uncharacterized membrane protein